MSPRKPRDAAYLGLHAIALSLLESSDADEVGAAMRATGHLLGEIATLIDAAGDSDPKHASDAARLLRYLQMVNDGVSNRFVVAKLTPVLEALEAAE